MDCNVVEDTSFKPTAALTAQKEMAPFEIDYLGNGTFQVTQLNLLMKRSIEPSQNSDAQLSARGLHHRSRSLFERDIKSNTNIIMLNSLHGGGQNDGVDGQSSQPEYHLFPQYFQRALAYERVGEMDLAINDYTTVLSIYPNYAPAHFNRAGLHNAQGRTELALQGINRAISLDPSNLIFRKNRSLLLRQKGNYIEAINETIICRAVIMQPSLGKELIAGNTLTIPDSTQLLQSFKESAPVDEVILSMQRRMNQSVLDTRKSMSRKKSLSSSKHQHSTVHLSTAGEVSSDDAVVEFLTKVPFFSFYSCDRKALGEFAKKLDMRTIEKGGVVYRSGEHAHSLLIVLSGEIVLVPFEKTETHVDNIPPAGNVPYSFKSMQKLTKGMVIGEEEIDYGEYPVRHTTSAVCSQMSTILELQSTDYKAITRKCDVDLRAEMKKMVSSCKPFSNFDEAKINYIVSKMKVMYYNMGEELLSSGEVMKDLCIVRSGVVKLIKGLPQPMTCSSPSPVETTAALPSLSLTSTRRRDRERPMSGTGISLSSPSKGTRIIRGTSASSIRVRDGNRDRDRNREGSAVRSRRSDDDEVVMSDVGVGSAHLSGLAPPGLWVIEKKWIDQFESAAPRVRRSSLVSRTVSSTRASSPSPSSSTPSSSSWHHHGKCSTSESTLSREITRQSRQAKDLRDILRSCSPSKLKESKSRASAFDSTREMWSSTVGLLGAGQIFGEISVLSPKTASPVSGIAYTKVEVFAIEGAELIAQGIRFNSTSMNWLNESFGLYNPSVEKISYYFKSKHAWEKEKEKIVAGVLKESTRIQARLERESKK